jgi:hypothetical protein
MERLARLTLLAALLAAFVPLPAPAARRARKKSAAQPALPPAPPPAPGRLRVRLNAPGRCIADSAGERVSAEIGAGQEGLLVVRPGQVRVVCESPGFDDALARVEVAPDQGVPLRLVLPRLEGAAARPPIDLREDGALDLPAGATPASGCRARLYPLPDVLAPLPPAAADTQLLLQLPQVRAQARDPENGGQPNLLLRSEALENASSYAVVFDGWLQAAEGGLHAFAVTSDDPVELRIEGRTVLRSPFLAGHQVGASVPANQAATAAGEALLSEGRWYRVELLARQRWAPFPWGDDLPQEVLDDAATNRGATLLTTLAPPGGPVQPLLLSLPEAQGPTASR